jgi:hypothetical protein
MSDLFLLAVDVKVGVITEDDAATEWLSRNVVFNSSELLFLNYVVAIELNEGNFTLVWTVTRLSEMAARRHSTVALDSPWWDAADLFLDVARRVLFDKPNGRRLTEARTVVELQLNILAERCGPAGPGRYNSGELQEYAETLKLAGGLFAGPYMDNRRRGWQSLAHWISAQHLSELSAPELFQSGQFVAMPSPDSALSEAKGYLKRAAQVGTGHVKGLSLALLATCIVCDVMYCNKRTAEDLGAILTQALVYLDPAEDPHIHARMVAYKAVFYGASSDWSLVDSTVRRALGHKPSTAAEEYAQIQALLELAPVLPNASPELLSPLWERVRALEQPADHNLRLLTCEALLHSFPENLFTCDAARQAARNPEHLASHIIADRNLSPKAKAATLIHLAVESGDARQAISLIQQSREIDPEFSKQNFDCSEYAEAAISLDWGLYNEKLGDCNAALEIYQQSAPTVAKLTRIWEWPSISHTLLLRVLECVRNYDEPDGPEAATYALVAFSIVAPQLGVTFDSLRSGLYWSLGVLIERLMSQGERTENPVLHYLHHRLAKGADFAYIYAAAGEFPFSEPLQRFLDRLDRIEAAEGIYVAGVDQDYISERLTPEVADLAYAGNYEQPDASLPRVHINRLRRAIDSLVSESIAFTASGRQEDPSVGFMFPRQQDLPENTVLISLFLGEPKKSTGNMGEHPRLRLGATWFTRQESGWWGINVRDVGAITTFRDPGAGSSRSLHSIAASVAAVREAVRVNAFTRPATLQARRLLGDFYGRLGGPPGELIRQWSAQGKRHLCFWPHGPLHYVPFALLEQDGRPLADDWTISSVPTDVVLYRKDALHVRQRLLIVGADPDGMAREESAPVRTHVRNLAKNFPGARLLDGQLATPARLLNAIPWATHVHIAAHGSHDAEATWFHCLYLNGDESGGRLFAHDVIRYDLRHVSLVTLSACESAMGRVDRNDNLRGLPAAFMLAGAATVIGALWPVSPNIADQFFTRLYGELGRGVSKLDAFRVAQTTTRSKFPSYRDWGAFTYIGRL